MCQYCFKVANHEHKFDDVIYAVIVDFNSHQLYSYSYNHSLASLQLLSSFELGLGYVKGYVSVNSL